MPAVAPSNRSQGIDLDLDSSIPQLALCTENDTPCRGGAPELALCSGNDSTGRRTPEAALSAQKESSSPELVPQAFNLHGARDEAIRMRPRGKSEKDEGAVGDENVPPSQEVQVGSTTTSGKLEKEAVQASNTSGRSQKIAKMCSYWESRMANQQSDSVRLDALGGSLRERNTLPSTVLRERQSEAIREVTSTTSPHQSVRETRSVSASLPRRSGAESRRSHRRTYAEQRVKARQQQLTDELTTLMHVVCPGESDGLMRSSGSESEPLSEEVRDEHDDWLRAVERENKILNKHLRQYTRLLTHFLQKRSSSCGPAICPSCSISLACPECGRSASTLSRTMRERAQGRARSSHPDTQAPLAALRERVAAQSMEPAEEPDSGLITN